MNAKDFHLDLAHVVLKFCDNMVQFAQSFAAEFVESSWNSSYGFVAWEPNEVLAEESRRIRN